MKIIIDIDENIYTRLFDNGEDITAYIDDMREIRATMRRGTSLPKGHGRLIDADAMIEKMNELAEEEYLDFRDCRDMVYYADVIIEADKGDNE